MQSIYFSAIPVPCNCSQCRIGLYMFRFDFSRVMLFAHATEINDNTDTSTYITCMYIYLPINRRTSSQWFLGQKIVKTMYAIRANIWHDKRQAPTTKNIEIVNKKKNKTKYYQMCANIFRFIFFFGLHWVKVLYSTVLPKYCVCSTQILSSLKNLIHSLGDNSARCCDPISYRWYWVPCLWFCCCDALVR